MEISELLQELIEQNNSGKGYQIELNSGNLDEKSNKITGVEYSINLGLGVNIKEEIENVFFDCQDGVCIINIKVKEDSKSTIEAKAIPEDFKWN